jgi:hypothetical protein
MSDIMNTPFKHYITKPPVSCVITKKQHVIHSGVYVSDILFSSYNSIFGTIDINDYKSKFQAVISIFKNNIFSDFDKGQLFHIFNTNQYYCHVIKRMIYLYKYNKASFYDNDYTLCGELLSSIPESKKITIFQDNKKYVFKISDIINIILKCLVNCPSLFVEPKTIKNPYTNIYFSRATLYNIYLTLRNRKIEVPIIIKAFYNENFDYDMFTCKHEPLILDEYLKTYKEELSVKRKYNLCIEIINKYRRTNTKIKRYTFPPKVSISKIVKNMEKILAKYLYVKYSQNNSCRFMYEREIINDLVHLITTNCNFADYTKNKEIMKARRCSHRQTIFKTLSALNIFRFNPDSETTFDTAEILTQHSVEYFDFNNPIDDINTYSSVFKAPVIEPKISEEMVRIMKNNQKRSRDYSQERERRTRMRFYNDTTITDNSDNVPRITTTIEQLSNSYHVEPNHENLTLLVDNIINYAIDEGNYAIDEGNYAIDEGIDNTIRQLEITGVAIDTNGIIGINQDGSIYEDDEEDENFQGYSPIEDEDEDEDSESNDEDSESNDDDSNVPTINYDDSESEGEIIAEDSIVHIETVTQQENDDVDTLTDEGYDSY